MKREDIFYQETMRRVVHVNLFWMVRLSCIIVYSSFFQKENPTATLHGHSEAGQEWGKMYDYNETMKT